MFKEIDNCQSGKEFLNKYKENLLLTPEDKSFPRNVTSLYTHLELVGKIYRVLEKNTEEIQTDNKVEIKYSNNICSQSIETAECEWQARLVKCWIRFPHSFVRLRDINLLQKREELITCLNDKDEVLFTTSDFIVLFLTLNDDLKNILEPFLSYGFHIEVEETLSNLRCLDSILSKKILCVRSSGDTSKVEGSCKDTKVKVYKRYLMPEILNELKPPICDICQQRRGVEHIKENVREWICEKCQQIRDIGEPFREYTNWEKEDVVKVCWFKFSLDNEKLEEWLGKAFEEYIKNHSSQVNELLDKFRPLALQVDFSNDYKEMLKAFWKLNNNDIIKPIIGYDELGVFKYSPKLTETVIKKYLELFEQYFPDCVSDEKSPISLSISIANIKYPIREHWRYLNKEDKNFLNVRYQRVFEEEYTKEELKECIEKTNVEAIGSLIYKLVELNSKSDIYTVVEILNNRHTYPQIYELASKGIKLSKFLNLYTLLNEDVNE